MASISWTPLHPKPDPKHGKPCARSSHGLSVVQGGTRLVLHGGENVARTPIELSQATWVADLVLPEVWQWRLVDGGGGTVPPVRVAHAQAVVGDGTVYIFGGRKGIGMGEEGMNDLWMLDVSGGAGKENWTEVTPAEGGDPPPEPRSFHRMIAVGNDLFVFGGCGASGRLADLHRFDTVKRTWQTLGASTLLRGRGGANLISLDGGKSLAVVAGFAGEETSDGHRFVLNDTGGTWEESMMDGLQDLRPRSVCVSGALPSKALAVVFGGEVDPSDRGHEGAGGFENDIIMLDGKTGAFIEVKKSPGDSTEWPEKRGWSDGSVFDAGKEHGASSLFLFGGLSGDDKNPRRLDDLWRCDISA